MNAVRRSEAVFDLITSPGCGSAIVEAACAMAGIEPAVREVAYDALAGDAELRALNPLAQVPTLRLADGTVLTESAAIVLHLADVAPAAGIAPPPGDPTRPGFLRWLAYLGGTIYPTFHHGDLPGTHADAATAQALTEAMARRRETLWRHVEAAAGTPWFLGDRRSALDAAIGVMTRWTPGLAWFATHAPKLHGIATRVAQQKDLRNVFKRNFGE